jgi:predicted AAA+ superfamily ATPase
VLNGVSGNFAVSADRLGRLFEHLVIQTIRATAQALDKDIRMSVFRTSGGAEVDLIIEDGENLFAIEIKATKKVTTTDFRGLAAFTQFMGGRKRKPKCLLVSLDEYVQSFEKGVAIPFSKLWEHLEWQTLRNH